MELSSRRVFTLLAKSRARIRVPDTYFLNKGTLEFAICSDRKSRCCRLKFKDPRSTADVLVELHRTTTQFSSTNKKVCYAYIRRTRSVLSTEDIEALLSKSRELPYNCVQAYLEPRTVLDQPQTLKVVALEGGTYFPTYSEMNAEKPLAALQLQQKMMKVAKDVMLRVQEAESKRIESLELEFIQDSDRLLWLVNVVSCRLAVIAEPQPSYLGPCVKRTASRRVLSQGDASEFAVPTFTKQANPLSTFTHAVEDIPVNLPEASTQGLPLVARIYEQMHEKQFSRNPKARSNSETPKLDRKIPSKCNIGKNICLESLDDRALLFRRDSSTELIYYTTAEDTDASPIKTERIQKASSNDTNRLQQIPHKRLPSNRSATSLNKRSLSSSVMPTFQETMRSISTYGADLTTTRMGKVVEKLQSRHMELSQKYGASPMLSHQASVGPIKLALPSPYTSKGIKIKP